MARLARVVAVDVPHHVTQRGNRREYILSSDAERMVYLDLLRQAVQLYPLSLIGYCLMSNHVHLIVIPHEADALALAFKRAHGQYASYWNASHAPDICLAMEMWRQHWSPSTWRAFLGAGESESALAALRKCTYSGRPFGSDEFVKKLELETARPLAPRKGGRPKISERNQTMFDFDLPT